VLLLIFNIPEKRLKIFLRRAPQPAGHRWEFYRALPIGPYTGPYIRPFHIGSYCFGSHIGRYFGSYLPFAGCLRSYDQCNPWECLKPVGCKHFRPAGFSSLCLRKAHPGENSSPILLQFPQRENRAAQKGQNGVQHIRPKIETNITVIV